MDHLPLAPDNRGAVAYCWFSPRPIDPRWTIGRPLVVVWAELVGLFIALIAGIGADGLLINRLRLHGTAEMFASILGLAALALTCAAAAAGPLVATRFRRTFATRATATAFATTALVIDTVLLATQFA